MPPQGRRNPEAMFDIMGKVLTGDSGLIKIRAEFEELQDDPWVAVCSRARVEQGLAGPVEYPRN
jgi:hypothetical protein